MSEEILNIPKEFIIPKEIVVSNEMFQKIIDMLKNPPEPPQALIT